MLNMKEDAKAKEYLYKMATNPKNVKYVYSIALPSEIIVFKMMRACVGVI